MKLIIEGYPYPAKNISPELGRLGLFRHANGFMSTKHVGYLYSSEIKDCVFFLPKVLLNQDNKVLGTDFTPEQILSLNKEDFSADGEVWRFLHQFPLWIYQAIHVFCHSHPDNEIVSTQSYSSIDASTHSVNSTLLDAVISLVRFNERNHHWVTFTLKNLHKGNGRINWQKTISKQQPFFQRGKPVYLNPIVKKKQTNFEDELFIIFFSILNHVNQVYGFNTPINYNFKLITGPEFEQLCSHLGLIRLAQIKHRYFSDRALLMWNLCFAFFSMTGKSNSSAQQDDFLLVSDFNIVFEAIIDDLLKDEKEKIPAKLREQADGKVVDHIYPYQSLVSEQESIYYIGDSKYYKIGHDVSGESRYKQYTYVRNVIQHNMDVFFGKGKDDNVPPYRDELTEGYNITPNFFISATVDDGLSYEKEGLSRRPDDDTRKINKHFDNRLFDRDTLWLSHYDINFLYVVSLYAKSNQALKDDFRKRVRAKFRKEIIEMLSSKYDFYKLIPQYNHSLESALSPHFRRLLGKVFRPDKAADYLILALDKNDAENNQKLLNVICLSEFNQKEFRLPT